MNILGVHHAGHTVANMERSLAFYRDLLGLTVYDDEILEGPEISDMVGIQNAKLRAVFLTVDGKRPFIELIEYHHPTGRPLSGDEQPPDIGNAHFSFLVPDIHQARQELEQAGVRFAGKALYADEGTFAGDWAAYCYDPDGMVVELWSTPPID